jgi:hypothetical protein
MYLAYWSPTSNETRNDSALVDSAEAWELVSSAKPATDTYTYEGVVYGLSAAYRDREGDVWRFTGHNTVNYMPGMECEDGSIAEDLGTIVDTWGPLTRV